MDRLTAKHRGWLMSRIRAKNTTPEMAVRSAIHRLGYRFRLHVKNLPGTPDLVFPCRKKVIFVHGCFWHGHFCKKEKMPKSRVEFWQEKIRNNKVRDRRNCRKLKNLGWDVMVLRECELKNKERMLASVTEFLNRGVIQSSGKSLPIQS